MLKITEKVKDKSKDVRDTIGGSKDERFVKATYISSCYHDFSFS